MNKQTPILIAAALTAPAMAADFLFEHENDFISAVTDQTIQLESFEGTPVQSGTSWDFGPVTYACAGTAWCQNPAFQFGGLSHQFGISDGQTSVFFSTPDSAIFTFAQPIIAFGIDVWGLATIFNAPGGGPVPSALTVTTSNGAYTYFENYASNGNPDVFLFAGARFDAPVSSLTLTGAVENDGIYFDRLQFVAAAVPEPGTASLAAVGGALLAGMAGRCRRRRA